MIRVEITITTEDANGDPLRKFFNGSGELGVRAMRQADDYLSELLRDQSLGRKRPPAPEPQQERLGGDPL